MKVRKNTMANVRTTAPSESNKYYKHTSGGGVNECIRINGYSCLPNCVGFAWGSFYEMGKKRPKLSRRNAKEWYGYTADGYARGKEPKLGAVACWGGTQYGHVAIVVGIYSDRIKVAQSNYGGNRFEVVDCYKTVTGYKSHGGNVHFQGFIYPDFNVSAETKTTSGITTGKNEKLANGKKYKTLVNLNMRDYPDSKTGKVKKLLKKGTTLWYYGYYAINNGTMWYWVTDGTTEGYVCGGGKLGSGASPYLDNCEN